MGREIKSLGISSAAKVFALSGAAMLLPGCITDGLFGGGGGGGGGIPSGNAIGMKLNSSGCTGGDIVNFNCAKVGYQVDTGLNANFATDANGNGTVTATGSTAGVTGPSGLAPTATKTDPLDGAKIAGFSNAAGTKVIAKKSDANDDFFLISSVDSSAAANATAADYSVILAHGGKATTANLAGKTATFFAANAGTASALYTDTDGTMLGNQAIRGDVNMTLSNNQVDGTITSTDADPALNGTVVALKGAKVSGTKFNGGSVSVTSNATFNNAPIFTPTTGGYSGGFYGTTGTDPNYVAGILGATGTTNAVGDLVAGKKALIFGSFWAKKK